MVPSGNTGRLPKEFVFPSEYFPLILEAISNDNLLHDRNQRSQLYDIECLAEDSSAVTAFLPAEYASVSSELTLTP